MSKKLASGKRIHELALLNRMFTLGHGLIGALQESLQRNYGQSMNQDCVENVVNIMTNEFPAGTGKKTYEKCVFLEEERDGQGIDYRISDTMAQILQNQDFYAILKELVEFGIDKQIIVIVIRTRIWYYIKSIHMKMHVGF